MSGEILADVATGALTARAVEPAHGEAVDNGHSHEAACLNCGTALIGSHCHACGQAAHVHKTLAAFFHDLLHGVFHFEGKIWRTLPLLAWNPGKLTREYIDGRRASYVSPIALFLFVVFLTFAAIHAVGDPVDFNGKGLNIAPRNMAEAVKEADAKVTAIEAELAAAKAKGERTEGIEGKLTGAMASRDALKEVEAGKLPDAVAAADSASETALAKRINAQWLKLKANPELALYKLQSSAYKYTWLLIPLSLPFLWLLFPFSRRFRLYDHTVFVTYSLSFMALLLTVVSMIVARMPGSPAAALVLYAPFHMYRQLRGTYGLSGFGAWWRTWALTVFALLVLVFWSLALLGMLISG